ncbi:EAL domain-containing protein [Allosphingosinicella flava]|uniref:EAL domain-containing protein n=1 Tax=Allosphingosinicella flava TaxID=2771430 RepID=A0A7T2GJS8_9SPHN|nr:GGDEF and EAL domain-containing protein [Sphingosinicella flava]QPQ55170.1 EAL domain-containing protein [Sphingosinicella flava]
MSEGSPPQLDWRVVFNRAEPPGKTGWGRVRAAQIQELSRSLSFAIWSQAFNAILLVFIIRDQDWRMLSGWLVAIAAMNLLSIHHVRRMAPRGIVARPAIEKSSYYGVIFGLLWAFPAQYFAPYADHTQLLAIGLITTGMMAAAAFILAPMPLAAGAYICIMGAIVTNMLAQSGSAGISPVGIAYTIGLLLLVLTNGRNFMQRKWVELVLEERSETISLLLREYETSDADWLWQTDRLLSLESVSARFARAIGREAADLEGQPILNLLLESRDADEGLAGMLDGVIDKIRKQSSFSEITVPLVSPQGVRCIELSARPRYDSNGRFIGYRGVGSDVTQARQAAERIQHMARHDPLTGMPNRLQVIEALGAAQAGADTRGSACAVMLLDLDRFKTVNDSLGHVAGDYLLQELARRIDNLIPAAATAGRLGGDEFAIVLPDTDREQVHRLAIEIIEAVKEPVVYQDQNLFVGVSIGAAFGPGDGDSVEELVRNADLALYRAKSSGGDDICFYEARFHESAEERRRLELALRTALENAEFDIHYQPVVNAETARIESFEALLRWHHPTLGDISPAKFVPIAEETGLIGAIGEWVLRTACHEAAQWPGNVRIAVNLSPRQLLDPNFLLKLVSALSYSNLKPGLLELEVTETVFLNLTPFTKKVLQQIHSLGVRLAMDDFGTGYSSLGYLRDTNFDTLKVDRTFVKSLSREDPGSGAIIRAVVALAGSLGMTTVAEGVETAEQLDLVREYGCDRVQGFIFSDPLTASDARKLLMARGAISAAA